jgi:DNA ligase-1
MTMVVGDISPDREAKKARIDPIEDTDEPMTEKQPQMSLDQYASQLGNGQTGPGSIWLYAKNDASYNPQSLNSHLFDPSQKLHGYEPPLFDLADNEKTQPCSYGLIAHALDLIENLKASGSGSRKKTIVVLTNLFRLIMFQYSTAEFIQSVYCIINKVGPDYEGQELGVADLIVSKAIADACGSNANDLRKMINSGKVADLGEAALMSRSKQTRLTQPPPLRLTKVFDGLQKMAEASGERSQAVRVDLIKGLLVRARDKEIKFIVRTLQGKLRVGIQNASVLQSLANAVCLTFGNRVGDIRKLDKDQRPENMKSKQQIEGVMLAMEDAVRQAFCEMPNYELVIQALLSASVPDPARLALSCHVKPGIPVKPMLAKPTRSVSEVLGRFTGIQFTAEYKYDGERAQIHINHDANNKVTINIYSRNSENMTEKYPDVIATLREMLAIVNTDGIVKLSSAIIDSEVVAFSPEEHKILPFQKLSTRPRKGVDIKDIKVQVCLFPFDLIFLNGESLVKAPLRVRRDKLRAVMPVMKEKLEFAVGRDLVTAEEVEAFLGEAIDHQCEGLMIKTLDENASYEPSKRSLNWLKLKKDYVEGIGDSVDLVPIGAYAGTGKRVGVYGAFLLAVYDQSSETYQTVCKIGTGFSDADLKQHYEFLKEHIIDKKRTDYEVSDALTPTVWFDPVQVWEVQAADLSVSPVHTAGNSFRSDGKGIGLRFPRFMRIRDDKGSEDSTSSEQILEMFENQFKNAGGTGGPAARDEEDDYDL